MASPDDQGSVWNGKRIKPIKERCLLGASKAREIIACLNGLLTWKVRVVDGQTGKVVISEGGTVIEIPKGGAATGDALSGSTRYRVKSVQGDYITCRTWDGSTEGGADVLIAKPPQLRHSLTAQTVSGVSVTYSDFAVSGGVCTRKANATSFTEQIEAVLPQWQIAGTSADAEIWADEPEGGTGVTVSGTPLTLMDTNRDARAWCQVA